MIEVKINDEELTRTLGHLVAGLRDPRGLMRALAGVLETETETNFARQGRPRWLGLSPRTLRRRGSGAQILQDTGQLAGSVATDYGSDFARIGSNKVYAAIHQFGGQAGRGKKVTIKARPYLPSESDGSLQAAAREGILREVREYLAGLVK